MRRMTIMVSLLLTLLLAGCNKVGTQAEPAKTVRPQPSTVAQPQPAAEPAKHTLISKDDPEFQKINKYEGGAKTLRQPETRWQQFIEQYEEFVKEFNPNYVVALKERQSRIDAKVASINDDQLRESLRAKAEQQEPPISSRPFVRDAVQEFNRQQQSYFNRYKDAVFVLATYDTYYPDSQVAVFNLFKFHNCGLNDKQYPFGSPYTAKVFNKLYYEHHDDQFPIDGHYKPDSLYIKAEKWDLSGRLDKATALNDAASYALVLHLTPQEMDRIYAAADQAWDSEAKRMWQEEMAIGGEWIYPTGGAQSVEEVANNRRYVNYDSEQILRLARNYVRRNAIWIVAKGDPFSLDAENCWGNGWGGKTPSNLQEAYLTIGGTSQHIKQLYPLRGDGDGELADPELGTTAGSTPDVASQSNVREVLVKWHH